MIAKHQRIEYPAWMSWGGSEGQRTSPAAVCNNVHTAGVRNRTDSNESEQRETCARFYHEHTITEAGQWL